MRECAEDVLRVGPRSYEHSNIAQAATGRVKPAESTPSRTGGSRQAAHLPLLAHRTLVSLPAYCNVSEDYTISSLLRSFDWLIYVHWSSEMNTLLFILAVLLNFKV